MTRKRWKKLCMAMGQSRNAADFELGMLRPYNLTIDGRIYCRRGAMLHGGTGK